MIKTLAIALLLGTAACGGGSKTEPTTPMAKTDGAPSLALGEMKLTDVNKNKSISIHADGSIELDGTSPAKVTADGHIITVADNKTVMTLGADGTVKAADGTDLGVKISADGSLTMKDQTISIDEAGNVKGGNADAPPLKVEGATSPELKRTAMFVLLTLVTSEPTTVPPQPAAVTPAT